MSDMSPNRPGFLRVLSGIAVVEGLAFLAYAVYDIVQAIRVGATGPSPVSNVPGLILQPLIFAVLGLALGAAAIGFWRTRRWARAPFVLIQLLILVVAVPLALASAADAGTGPHVAGIVLTVVAVGGLVLTFFPSTTAALAGRE
jgi:peptidoglycan/LPS O-acetylase OafA/YrhL